jgi:hypothetical protein
LKKTFKSLHFTHNPPADHVRGESVAEAMGIGLYDAGGVAAGRQSCACR